MSGVENPREPMPPVVFKLIGRVVSPFLEKFGAPRQPGLVPSATGEIVLDSPFGSPDALRGLEGFSHLWVVFLAHGIPATEEFQPTVRPPRLGGNTRVGVFASRSLFRPNPIGLSLVRLLEVRVDGAIARLLVGGLDILDGTPVLDLKPYLPYAEALPDAKGGFAAEAPAAIAVTWSAQAEADLLSIAPGCPQFRLLVEETLAADPRPAYHDSDGGRTYAMLLDGLTVSFQAGGAGLVVTALRRA